MKKILFLLLSTIAMYGQVPADATPLENIQITNNVQDNSATKVTVQDDDGVQNWLPMANLPVSTATTNALELETDVSAGAITGFALTNNGDGTVNIASGTAFLRTTNDPYAQIIKYPISAVTNLALTDNANNFVLVDYNAGSPTITVTNNASTINTQTNSLAYVIARVGNNLEYLNLVGQNVDPNAKLRIRFLNQEGIRRASGAVLGFSNRNLTLTSSVLFSGLIRVNAAAFNTASPDTFTLAYNNGSVWTRTTGQTEVNNTQYNVSGTLTTMPNNTFRTDYIYLLPNNPSKLYVIMGNTTYGSLTLAKGAPRPSSLPVELQVLGLEVGRLFIEKNSAAISEVQSSFANDFIGAAVPEHNSLTGLQGGTAGEYNHLTNAQVALVNAPKTLQYSYDNGSQITTTTALGAVAIRRGSAADSDNILVGQNGSGTNTFSVTGAGNIAANNIIDRRTISQIRAFTGALPSNNFYTTDSGQEGNWYYDPTDTITSDNTGTVLVTSDGKRIKRIFNGDVLATWFGAKGDDSTDNTTAFQNAIDYASNKKNILIPTGIYRVSNTLTLVKGSSLKGENTTSTDFRTTSENTVIKFMSATVGDELFDVTASGRESGYIWNVSIKNMSLKGTNISNSIGIKSNYLASSLFQDIKITNFGYGISVHSGLQNNYNRINISACQQSCLVQEADGITTTQVYNQCVFRESPWAVIIKSDATSYSIDSVFNDLLMESTTVGGVNLHKSCSASFNNTYAENCPDGRTITDGTMFRVHKDGNNVSVFDSYLNVTGGTLGGDNFGLQTNSNIFDIGESKFISLNAVVMKRAANGIITDSSTRDNSILLNSPQFLQVTNLYVGSANKISGIFPETNISGVQSNKGLFQKIEIPSLVSNRLVKSDSGILSSSSIYDVSGNLGINVSPNFNLNIHSSTSDSYSQFTNTSTGSASSDGLLIGINSGLEAQFYNSENGAMAFFTNGTRRATFSNGGVFTINDLSGSGTRVVTADASGGLSASVDLASKADLLSPSFTGTPTAPTATAGTNTTQIATTAFVQANKGSEFNNQISGSNFMWDNTKSATKTSYTTFDWQESGLQGKPTDFVFNGSNTQKGYIRNIKASSDADYTIGETFDYDGNRYVYEYKKSTTTSPGWRATNNLKLGTSSVNTLISNGVIRLKNYTVATLPAGTQGDTAYVTDATAPTYLGTLTGGGSVVCPVFYNGTAWVSH